MYKCKYNVKVYIHCGYFIDEHQAKDWVNNFLTLGDWCEGFQWHTITPYIHIYGVPCALHAAEVWQSQFSGQG